jgi:hypothetical protein
MATTAAFLRFLAASPLLAAGGVDLGAWSA